MEACSIINKSTLHLVGISYCGPYSTFPDEALRLQSDFLSRKHQLSDSIHRHVLYCPYDGNEAFATYWACFEGEVHDTALPDGMVAITIPPHRYAVFSCTTQRIGEGYEILNSWINENGYQRSKSAVSMEVYFLEGNRWEEEVVDLFVPLEDE